MKVPLSWLREFVEIDEPILSLANRLTVAGLEVEELRFVGPALPSLKDDAGGPVRPDTRITGLAWEPDKVVVGAVLEVMPHPNADRLVLCRLNDGHREHVVLTGAPNLFPFKGQGPLPTPLKVAYAGEGATLFDGHQAGWELMTLKRAKIRGVESYSMACSEKELGISDEHEGIILLDEDAPVGSPLVEYMGDVVMDIAITPNMARAASVLGVAREVAALTGKPLNVPSTELDWNGPPLVGRVGIEIERADLNPRFVLGLIEGVKLGESPYWVQRRLRLSGMRPINNIVDATNYVMLAIGQPLHAFDYDVLQERAQGGVPALITRQAVRGEKLETLDGVERSLDDFTVLVTDRRGALSIAGVIGGSESEVQPDTKNVLLEGANWEFINIRQTLAAQNVTSEAGYRFSRGVHPALAESGVRLGLAAMQLWAGGTVARGLVDAYPQPVERQPVAITPSDARRWLGIELTAGEMADMLSRLGFGVALKDDQLRVEPPDHRLDIGQGVIGKADLMEEIARLYGYDRIPETLLSDALPPQRDHVMLERETRVRDCLVRLGLQEIITYRLTSPEREARLRLVEESAEPQYIRLANPIAADRAVMRRELLPGMLEVLERNVREAERIAVFEIGPVFLPQPGEQLPAEPLRLGVVMYGRRVPVTWMDGDTSRFDYFDLKGVLTALFQALNIPEALVMPAERTPFHPGKGSAVVLKEEVIGGLGELHPEIRSRLDVTEAPILAAELDLSPVLEAMAGRRAVTPVSPFPPVLEDLAVVVEESTAAQEVESVLWRAGGPLLAQVTLFDVYRGEQIGAGKKSLAYALTYRAPDRTLTDEEVHVARESIVENLRAELGASLRA
jgi:phenylalanyl-tRNA synthetase beta chain